MPRCLSNLNIIGLYYVLIVVKGLLQEVESILAKTPNDQGVVDTKLETMLPNIQEELDCVLEAFPSSSCFYIKHVQERVDCTIAYS